MAYQYKKDEDIQAGEGDQNAGQMGGGQNLVTNTGSSSLVGAGGGSGGGSGSPNTGSGWTNLQDYVGANQGESARGANRIVDEVSGQREATTKAVTDLGNTDVKGFERADDTFLSDLRAGRSGRGGEAGNLYAQGYSGPAKATGIEGYDKTQTGYEDFERTSNALDDPYQLTEEYNPGGNLGEKNLDRFFYQQKPAQEIFQRESAAGDTVDDLWANANTGLQGRLDAERAAFGAQKGAIKGAFDQGLAGFEGAFNPIYNQGYVDKQNASRQAEFNALMGKGGDKGQKVGDATANFGDASGYDWDRMFNYTGNTTLGDYVDPKKAADYRGFLGEYGDTFGAQDRFGGADLTASGTRDQGAYNMDYGQKDALSEMLSLYNSRENDRSLNQGRYDQLKTILGLEGFSDARALPPTITEDSRIRKTPDVQFDPTTYGDDNEQQIIEQVFGPDVGKKLDPRNW